MIFVCYIECSQSDFSFFFGKSGWIVIFLMIIRGDGPPSGYVSTGFFGGEYLTIVFVSFFVGTFFFLFSTGLTLGRVVLVGVVRVTKKVIHVF